MKRRFSLLALAGVWVVLVLVSTSAVWWAISHAGARVTSVAAPQLPTTGATITPAPTSSPTSARPSSAPPSTREPTRSSKTPSAPRTTATRTRAPAPVAVQRSWRGTAGRVTATCRGARITLDAAVPADGYTVDIEGRGPEALEVEFHQSAGGENETKVRGTCRSGEPQFSVERD